MDDPTADAWEFEDVAYPQHPDEGRDALFLEDETVFADRAFAEMFVVEQACPALWDFDPPAAVQAMTANSKFGGSSSSSSVLPSALAPSSTAPCSVQEKTMLEPRHQSLLPDVELPLADVSTPPRAGPSEVVTLPMSEPTTPPKRRCLKGKQPTWLANSTLSWSDKQKHIHKSEAPPLRSPAEASVSVWPETPDKVQYDAFWHRYTKWAKKYALQLKQSPPEGPQNPVVHLGGKASIAKKIESIRVWLSEDKLIPTNLKSWVQGTMFARMEDKQNKTEPKCVLNHKHVLLTYNGPWGRITDAAVLSAATEARTRFAVEIQQIGAVVSALQSCTHVKRLWADMTVLGDTFMQRQDVQDLGYSLELCTKSFVAENAVRVHFHLCLRGKPKIRLKCLDKLAFRRTPPHISEGIVHSTRAASRANGFQAMHYVQVNKVGSIFRYGTREPYTEYQVNGDWILGLCQARKLTYTAAKAELVRCAKNLPRNLQTLDLWWNEQRKERLRDLQAEVQMQISLNTRASRRVPAVDHWLQQFLTVQRRYKFLVLDGPTRMGKTEFAKSLVGPGQCLELNMSAASEPNLRDYDHEEHELILFDECSIDAILRQKRLFQAPACVLSLGASATNCFAYDVWVHRKKLVVATNVWRQSLQGCTKADQEWLQGNSVYVFVDAPLWITEDAS